MKSKPVFATWLFLLSIIGCQVLFASCSELPGLSKGPVILRIDGDPLHEKGLGAQVERFADADSDGFPDIIAAAPLGGKGEICVYSGRTGELIYRISSEHQKYSLVYFSIVADLDGDGISEIAAPSYSTNRGLWVFSGKDGSPLFKAEGKLYFDRAYPPKVLSVPDKNSDGVMDLSLEQPRSSLIVFSGMDGSKIMEMDPLKTDYDHIQHGMIPDMDGDGADDILGFTYSRREDGSSSSRLLPHMLFLSSSDFEKIGGPFGVPLQQRPYHYRCTDVDGDGVLDMVAAHSNGGMPDGSVLLAISGKDGSELWRVNGMDVADGAQIIGVDAKTGEQTRSFTDLDFGNAIALLPDIDGDGVDEIATGHTMLYNKELRTNGRIYVFSGSDGTILKMIPSPDRNTRVGRWIAPFEDRDLNGTPDILAGSPSATVDQKEGVGSILVLSM